MKSTNKCMRTFHWRNPFIKNKDGRLGISNHIFLEIAVVCILILAIGIPRWFALNRFVTTDEILWLERSGKFYYALAQHDFAATFQKSHPGVITMWAGLTGYLEVYPQYADDPKGQNRPVGLNTLSKRDSELPLRILTAGRRIIVLLNVLALGLSFLLARRLFGILPALAGFLLIAFDPFHIALTRILHLDGLLADLMLLSLLAFLVYLEDHRWAILLVSAVAAGLASLTKSPGLFLIPLIFLLVLLDWFSVKKGGGVTWQKSGLYNITILAIWCGIAALVFCLLWPAMWVDPLGSLIKVLTDAVGYAQEGHASAVFFNGYIYPNGEIPDTGFYPINFLWRTTPITILGLIVTPIFLIRAQAQDRGRRATIALLLLALGFGTLMSLGLKKFDRYILPSIVSLDLVSGVSLVWLIKSVERFLHEKWRNIVTSALFLGFVSTQATLAWGTFPYFFSYYNPLLGGSQRAAATMQIGWGEGLDQAARYINNKPNVDKLRVLAWYANGPFSYFSKSEVVPLDVDHPWAPDDWNQFNKSDYVVVYIHEWQRNLPAEVLERLRSLKPEYSVWMNGLEYVRIYKTPRD